ncbi:uncharacterized protein Hap1MRO34_004276 [Clarias gariepinus]|uniref:uncharacterized protein LOC128526440 n=1 Tax=Clarias gariepinus TaxID=13013 RepID=UPI00234E22ED|nr:uncharacterized protein LOC128526440 [Clarias gariepinus]
MESRLIVVVVFVCAVCHLTGAQLFPVTALNTNITNTKCGTSKLCVSSVTGCDPAGNSSCYFSSTQVSNGVLTVEISGTTSGYVALGLTPTTSQTQILTQGPVVFVCGNNNSAAFFETANLSSSVLTPTSVNINIGNVYGSVTENQSLNQSLIQCTFNINLNSTFLNNTFRKSSLVTLLNSTVLNSDLLNSTPLTLLNSTLLNSTLLNSSPFNSTILPFLNSNVVISTLVNSTLLALVNSNQLNSSVLTSSLLSLLNFVTLNSNDLSSTLFTVFSSTPLNSDLRPFLNNNLFNSTLLNSSSTQSTLLNILSFFFQNSPFSTFPLLTLLNSTLLSVPAQLPFNITILNGTTKGTQLGNASTVFTSSGPLDLANPRSNVPVPLNITRNGCSSTKLCLSSASNCDPAGNGSCFFTSVRLTNQAFFFELSGTTSGYVALALTKNGVTYVFACGNNSNTFFFQTDTQNGTTLTPANVMTVYNNVGVVLQNQTLIQCLFNTTTNFTTNISPKTATTTYKVTILNGTTSGTQLGPANVLYDSQTALDLTVTNPQASRCSTLITSFCTNVLAVLLSALTLHLV